MTLFSRSLCALLALGLLPGSCADVGTASPHDDDDVPAPQTGGVVTTGQKLAPAGMQTVFDGRVQGVAFGADGEELLVLIRGKGELRRLRWRENRELPAVPFPGKGAGSPGIQGIRLDEARGIPLISWVGALPDSKAARPPTGAQLAALHGDSLQPVSGILGKTEVGAPAAARGLNAQGQRIAVVPLCHDNLLAILDLEKGELLRNVPTGIAPFGAVVDAAGTIAYVTNWAGRRPEPGDETAKAGRAAGSDDIVVDARGIAATATVTRIDLTTGEATHTIPVGLHPTAIAWDEDGHRVYVADGNADAISVIDSQTNADVQTIAIAPFRDQTAGLAPTALVLSPDGATLFVALGGINAVAVLDAPRLELKGLIPTAWYPSSLALTRDGKTLAVGAMLGIGSGTVAQAKGSPSMKAGAGFVHNYRGAVNVIAVPGAAELATCTLAVAANARLPLASSSRERLLQPARTGVAPRAVPERSGEPSPIEHVVFIVKENRTYDQVFGDLGKGNSDPSLCIYGQAVTPNQHRLASQFVLLDNFYATGGNSGDGHQWLTQANETDYAMWAFTGRSYPFEGSDPIAPAAAGFLWTAAREAGRTVTIFGEYAGTFAPPGFPDRVKNLEAWRSGDDFKGRIHHTAPNRSVDALLAHEYPGYGLNIPDVVRAGIFLAHLREWQQAGTMPHLVLIQLCSDHTGGTRAGYSTPAACVADNDLAVGRIVAGLSHSPFWPKMAIFVVEDDAQGGVDHVDGHRTVALAISPYIMRGSVDSTMYAQQSMLKTIELMLGLRPLSVFDLTATAMSASFLAPGAKPDLTPYEAVEPQQSIYELNPQTTSLLGPARDAALQSARMDFRTPDAAPSEALNRILWHTAKGWQTPYPDVKRSLFFPMAVDLADSQRTLDGDDERGR
jgi:YVTN family beta-propeller protein